MLLIFGVLFALPYSVVSYFFSSSFRICSWAFWGFLSDSYHGPIMGFKMLLTSMFSVCGIIWVTLV
jgi:hypothetical protein